jgi:hypothetical protein
VPVRSYAPAPPPSPFKWTQIPSVLASSDYAVVVPNHDAPLPKYAAVYNGQHFDYLPATGYLLPTGTGSRKLGP